MNQKIIHIIKQNKFICALIFALVISVMGTIYCVVFGQKIASSHLEPCGLAFYQGVLALVITIIFVALKSIRKQLKWFVIPSVLFIFSFIYEFIVSFYPCCIGG